METKLTTRHDSARVVVQTSEPLVKNKIHNKQRQPETVCNMRVSGEVLEHIRVQLTTYGERIKKGGNTKCPSYEYGGRPRAVENIEGRRYRAGAGC